MVPQTDSIAVYFLIADFGQPDVSIVGYSCKLRPLMAPKSKPPSVSTSGLTPPLARELILALVAVLSVSIAISVLLVSGTKRA